MQESSGQLSDVVLTPPPSSTLIALASLAMAILVVTGAFLGEYTKRVTASGILVPDKGLIRILPPAAGTILSEHATEGQPVRSGDVLFTVDLELRGEHSERMKEMPNVRQLAQQRLQNLQNERADAQTIHRRNLIAVVSRTAKLRLEHDRISDELRLQSERIDSARSFFAKWESLRDKAFISDATLKLRTDDLLEQQSRFRALERNRIQLEREIDQADADQSTLPLQFQTQLSSLDRQIASATAEVAEAGFKERVLIRAPIPGTVSANVVHVGDAVKPTSALVSIIPDNSRLQAHFMVPSRSVGFVRPGQKVKLRYHAFPFQKFGQYHGVVSEVSATGIPLSENQLTNELAYRVSVDLDSAFVTVYGRQQALQPGMSVDAEIMLDRRRLIEWVFEPLYSISGFAA